MTVIGQHVNARSAENNFAKVASIVTSVQNATKKTTSVSSAIMMNIKHYVKSVVQISALTVD